MPDVFAAGTLAWLPADGRPEQLLILLHGRGAEAASMAPLAVALRAAFVQAALLAPQGFEPADDSPAAVAATLPRLRDWVHAAQQATGVGPAATALAGFAQGATLALELAGVDDGIAGRVLAFSGRFATLPAAAPRLTTLHLLHGADDAVIPAAHAREALQHLGALQGDATLDIASATGHELAPVLIDSALHRLRTHIPHRTWAAALGAAPPGLLDRQS